MNIAGNCTVTLVSTVTTTDAYGDTTTVETEVPVAPAVKAPRSSGEQSDPRFPSVITGLTLYLPHGTVLDANDKVRVDGRLYAVEGESADWTSPFTGWAPGVEVAVTRWEQL